MGLSGGTSNLISTKTTKFESIASFETYGYILNITEIRTDSIPAHFSETRGLSAWTPVVSRMKSSQRLFLDHFLAAKGTRVLENPLPYCTFDHQL